MFASRAYAGLQGGGGKSLDVPVATLAGLSVAFLAFAVPADLLGELVAASGLPNFISAAQPPLGFKARIALGAASAVAIFAVTFLLLRWLERFGARREERAQDAAFDAEPPRLRRRDVHPDAPARAPLLAVHELGEPDLELDQPAPLWDEPAPPGPAPSWAEPPAPAAVEPEPAQAASFEPEPLRRDPEAEQANAYALSQYRWSGEAPDEEPEPVADHPWLAEPPAAAEPEWTDAPPEPPEPAADIAPEPEPVAESPEPWPAAATPEIEPEAEGEPAPVPLAARPQTGSIAELMERLQQGLARRRYTPPPAALPVAEPTRPAVEEPADDRLQSAIESLQRFASRQD